MLKRFGNLIRGFLGLFLSGLERRNPEALIEVEKENLRRQISEYNKGLAAHAGLCERLMSQVRKQERELEELRARTLAHLQSGNRDAAGRFALRFKDSREQLVENRRQLEQAEKTYQGLVRTREVAVKAARDKIETLRRDIDEMRMKKAIADLNEMAAGMVGEIGGAGDTLNRLHEMVREETDKAAGRSRAARDSTAAAPELSDLESDQKALEDLALADFAAAAGITLEIPPLREGPSAEGGESSAPGKTM